MRRDLVKKGRKPKLIYYKYYDRYEKKEVEVWLKRGKKYCDRWQDFGSCLTIIKNVYVSKSLDDIDIVGDCVVCKSWGGFETIRLFEDDEYEKDYIDWALSRGKYEQSS